jgi:hypothetical protein
LARIEVKMSSDPSAADRSTIEIKMKNKPALLHILLLPFEVLLYWKSCCEWCCTFLNSFNLILKPF